jgi:hypothetical protein
MPRVEFEPATLVFEREKTVHASASAASAIVRCSKKKKRKRFEDSNKASILVLLRDIGRVLEFYRTIRHFRDIVHVIVRRN